MEKQGTTILILNWKRRVTHGKFKEKNIIITITL